MKKAWEIGRHTGFPTFAFSVDLAQIVVSCAFRFGRFRLKAPPLLDTTHELLSFSHFRKIFLFLPNDGEEKAEPSNERIRKRERERKKYWESK